MPASDGSPRTTCTCWRRCRSRSPTGSGGRCWSAAPGAPTSAAHDAGVIIFDGDGNPESLSPAPGAGSPRWSRSPRLPPRRSPGSSRRSRPGPAPPTPARTRCRSTMCPAGGHGGRADGLARQDLTGDRQLGLELDDLELLRRQHHVLEVVAADEGVVLDLEVDGVALPGSVVGLDDHAAGAGGDDPVGEVGGDVDQGADAVVGARLHGGSSPWWRCGYWCTLSRLVIIRGVVDPSSNCQTVNKVPLRPLGPVTGTLTSKRRPKSVCLPACAGRDSSWSRIWRITSSAAAVRLVRSSTS